MRDPRQVENWLPLKPDPKPASEYLAECLEVEKESK